MDSLGFHYVVKNFTHLSADESADISQLRTKYPYSQLLQLLYARAAKDLRLADQEEALHHSAVYSTDRSVLKSVMTEPRKERIIVPKPEPAKINLESKTVPPVVESNEIKPVVGVPSVEPVKQTYGSALSGEALREDLLHELEKLQKLKHDFEVSVDEFAKSHHPADVYNAAVSEPVSEPLLEEIRVTKKQLEIDNPKQRAQNEIIDKFIKTQPIIPRPKSTAPADDLSEDSGMFSDNIVSETLVDILLKQGKKEKAIEVLKKLIWKFPQKKAYFAAQIENLKN